MNRGKVSLVSVLQSPPGWLLLLISESGMNEACIVHDLCAYSSLSAVIAGLQVKICSRTWLAPVDRHSGDFCAGRKPWLRA